MEHLFKQLMEEKHDFYHYLDLYEDCTDATVKATLYTIAEQESHHYKMIHDLIFKETPGKVWTPMESVIKHQAGLWYQEMVEELKEHK